MEFIPKSPGVWQSGSCFIANAFKPFSGKLAVVVETEPMDLSWPEIQLRDDEVKKLGLGHLYLGGELGLFSKSVQEMITAEAKFYRSLVSGLNAEFLSDVSVLLAQKFEDFLKKVSFEEAERFRLLGLIKSYLVDAEALLFRQRIQDLKRIYLEKESLPLFEYEKRLLGLRKLLRENIAAQAALFSEMAETVKKVHALDPELQELIELASKVYVDSCETPVSQRAGIWSHFLKRCGIAVIIPGNPDNQHAVAVSSLLSGIS